VEWQTNYEKTHYTINQILTDLELNARLNALGLQGEELTDQVDLDYWTDGKYRHLLGVCRKVMTRFVQDQQHLSTEELTRMHTELFPVMRERFESIIYEARLNALNSQLRMNIAERALEALENHGFTLNEAGYINEDMRAPFMAHLDNSDGSRVTVQVLPTDQTTQELSNELVVVTNHPYLKTEHEARLQWEELCRTLHQYDLNVSRPEVRSAPPLTKPDPDQQALLTAPKSISLKRQHNV
jgi:thioesterase domain-containing protein